MNIFFRVDASSLIGSGHVIRCLTLAKELKKQGHQCKFICRDHKYNLIKKIKKENFKVFKLPNLKNLNKKFKLDDRTSIYSKFLGINWREDAKQTIEVLKEEKKIDWLVIDHYGLDLKWEKKLRKFTEKIMVIDDLANRNHDCDLLLDQNLTENYKSRYKNFLNKNCNLLLGPQYSLLQKQYRDLHQQATIRTGKPKKILIFFGATDERNITGLIIESFYKLNKKDIFLNVVIGSSNSQKEKIIEKYKSNKNIKFYSDLDSLANLMLDADLAFGACGTSSWERCCLGLPSISITIAENQISIAKELNRRGLTFWLGDHYNVTKKQVYDFLKIFINKNLERMSRECKLVTDGYGALKVAASLTLNNNVKLKAREAELRDETLLLNWANDPLVRTNSFNSKLISLPSHKKWFQKCLKSPDSCRIIIVETQKKLPIGQVRVEKNKYKWVIDFSLASFARKKKIGTKMFLTAINRLKKMGIMNFKAQVKKKNYVSSKIFKNAGFTEKKINKDNFITFFY